MEPASRGRERRDLSGEWRFELDPGDVGIEEGWFERRLTDTIRLPGTTNERGKGEFALKRNGPWEDEVVDAGATSEVERVGDHLTQPHPYRGAAWYQRTVSIPEACLDGRVVLRLERTRPSTVWVAGRRVGSRHSLSTPHRYDLSSHLSAGENVITVRIDNDAPPVTYTGVQRSHMATEHTQTNWNGITGEPELVLTDRVWIKDVRVIPDRETGTTKIEITVGNDTGRGATGVLDLQVRGTEGEYEVPPTSVEFAGEESTTVAVAYDLDGDPPEWDEFGPERLELVSSLTATAGDLECSDETTTGFGLRTVATDGTQFRVNGRTTFLRGTVDCCVFPRTGYAPTDRESWREHLGTIREYGFNHVRFHSWCPPKAAFEVADELGLYLQPELPLWNNGGAFEDDDAAAFYRGEARRILDTYGNHPSFLTFALGNELSGDEEAMADLVESLREADGRRLYAAGAYNGLSDSSYSPSDDFWTTASAPVEAGDATAESDAEWEAGGAERVRVRGTKGHIEREPPATDHAYDDVVASVPAPVVSHESGQFQVYPDFAELSKYDGALEPDNLELARDHLEAHEMLDRADEFAAASGQLALRCYREEVETALRTRGFGGFELLALQDFPGQGTALVGLLDSFMDPKGIVDPGEWRSVCSSRVPLVRMDARSWTTRETFEATVEVANYGPGDVDEARVDWRLLLSGDPVASGVLPGTDLPQGEVTELGSIRASLSEVDAPTAATLSVEVPAIEASTSYDVWVFEPGDRTPETPDGVVVERAFDERVRERLEDGEDVLLVPEHDDLAHSLEGQFQPDLWSYSLFKHNAPAGTLGAVCDADHPALSGFSTENFGNWQWWHLLRQSRPLPLGDAPRDFEPIVGMVDNIERNHRLGVVFETAIAEGNLLVSTIDLFACADHPAGQALYGSLADYVQSGAFDPDPSLSVAVLNKLLR